MKRTVLFALMTALLLLSACGSSASRGREKFEDFRDLINEAERISFTAVITADYGDSVLDFGVYCERANGETYIETTSPELIKGFKARVSDGGTKLEYDGAVLDIGDLTDSGMSPLSSFPAMLGALQTGHIENVWLEKQDGEELTAVSLLYDGESLITAWTAGDELRGFEITSNGETVVHCKIADWSVA